MTEDMNKMTDTPTVDQSPAPNGHGINGVTNGEPRQNVTPKEGASENGGASSKKTKAQRRAEKKATAAAAE